MDAVDVERRCRGTKASITTTTEQRHRPAADVPLQRRPLPTPLKESPYGRCFFFPTALPSASAPAGAERERATAAPDAGQRLPVSQAAQVREVGAAAPAGEGSGGVDSGER